MAIGRPLSINTIVKRLRHLRDNVFYDTVEQHVLDAIANTLADNPNQPIKHLRTMIVDLQSVLDTMPMHATDAEVKMLASCVDGLARIETDRIGATKELKALSKSNARATKNLDQATKPDWMLANEAAQMAVTTQVRDNTVQALTGAMRVLLDEIDSGEADSDDFDAIVHLARTLQRLY